MYTYSICVYIYICFNLNLGPTHLPVPPRMEEEKASRESAEASTAKNQSPSMDIIVFAGFFSLKNNNAGGTKYVQYILFRTIEQSFFGGHAALDLHAFHMGYALTRSNQVLDHLETKVVPSRLCLTRYYLHQLQTMWRPSFHAHPQAYCALTQL